MKMHDSLRAGPFARVPAAHMLAPATGICRQAAISDPIAVFKPSGVSYPAIWTG